MTRKKKAAILARAERKRKKEEELQKMKDEQQQQKVAKETTKNSKSEKSNNNEADEILPINKSFAEKYDARKRRELLNSTPAHILQNVDINDDKDGEEWSSSSSSEEEDEFGELLTKGIDKRVRDTLEAIRKKDPRIYDKNTKFFDDADENENEEDNNEDEEDSNVESDDEPVAGWETIANAAEQNTPKLTMKDYVRENLLKHGNLSDDNDDDDENSDKEQPDYDHERDEVSRAALDDDDGESTRKAITKATQKEGKKQEKTTLPSTNVDENEYDEENEDEDEDDSDGDFFTKREKTDAEIEAEQKDLDKFIANTAKKNSKSAGEDLLLHSYLEKETPDEKERFLRDFVLNNGWLDKNSAEAPSAKDYEIEIDLPNTERSEKNDDNDNSDDGGKKNGEDSDEFDEKVDAFEAEYNFRFEDPDGDKIVSHARNVPDSMRRPDDRRKRAREARKERKRMERVTKDEEIKRLKNVKKREIQSRLLAIKEAAGEEIDLNGLDLDGDFDPDKFNQQMEQRFGDDYYNREDDTMKETLQEQGVMTASEAKLNVSNDVNEADDEIRENVNKMMEEYYNLDYEDIIGGQPMRFNYKQVEPESFNLSARDILTMEDKELNRLVSVKYLAPYRAKREVSKQAWRVKEELKKQRREDNLGEEGHGEEEQKDKEGLDGKSKSSSQKKRHRQKRRKTKHETVE